VHYILKLQKKESDLEHRESATTFQTLTLILEPDRSSDNAICAAKPYKRKNG